MEDWFAFAMAGLQVILRCSIYTELLRLGVVDGRTWGCITIVVAIATLLIAVILPAKRRGCLKKAKRLPEVVLVLG